MNNEIFGDRNFGFGMMRLPLTDPENPKSVDIDETKAMVDRFMEAGFTYFDTAYMYCGGRSELAVREALSERHDRNTYTLADKLHIDFLETKEDRDRVFFKQLSKCGVEYFDYYLLHGLGRESYRMHEELQCFEWLSEKKNEGLARHMGFSYHDGPETLDTILTEHPETDFVQIQLNYLDYDSMGVRSGECLEVCRKHGKPVVVMEPLKGGLLVNNVPSAAREILSEATPDMSLPEWGIRFAAGEEGVGMVLSGMGSLSMMDENISFMKDFHPLSRKELEALSKARTIIEDSLSIPCTGCSYCTEGCPVGMPIPRFFSLYNMEKFSEGLSGWSPQRAIYERMTMDGAKAGDCVRCGQCEFMCPQHIHIVDELARVADYFEKNRPE